MVSKSLAEAIARGEVKLLGVDDILSRLGVSRSTFERWLRNGRSATEQMNALLEEPRVAGYESYAERLENQKEGNIKFPPADVMIGKTPKWEESTLVQWIITNTHDNRVK